MFLYWFVANRLQMTERIEFYLSNHFLLHDSRFEKLALSLILPLPRANWTTTPLFFYETIAFSCTLFCQCRTCQLKLLCFFWQCFKFQLSKWFLSLHMISSDLNVIVLCQILFEFLLSSHHCVPLRINSFSGFETGRKFFNRLLAAIFLFSDKRGVWLYLV